MLSISVVGNRLVNGAGETVRLLGVNRESTEYACTYGDVSSGPIDAGDAAAIAAWGADAVRVPLNEDCWLGINGLPADGLSAASYQAAIEGYVADLNADGIYAILDLHWSAPGTTPSGAQYPMPDDHSVPFWSSLAGAFASNPAVVFDAFNEPYSPAADGWSGYPVSWSCWEDGGCTLPNEPDGTPPSANPLTYTAVGMQQLVSAIRAAGANQPIMLGGLSYANDLSQWLAYEPSDPDGQLVASFHNYNGEQCDDVNCWNATIAPLAAQIPVVTGEFDEDDCPAGGGADPTNFDNTYMNWADAHGISYLAWGWLVLSADPTCDKLTLIDDYSGTPADPNGVALRAHLLALTPAAGATGGTSGPTTVTGTQPPSSNPPTPVETLAELLRAPALRRAGALLSGSALLEYAPSDAGTLTITIRHAGRLLARGSHSYSAGSAAELAVRATGTGRRFLRRHAHASIKITAAFKALTGAGSSASLTTSLAAGS